MVWRGRPDEVGMKHCDCDITMIMTSLSLFKSNVKVSGMGKQTILARSHIVVACMTVENDVYDSLATNS